MIADEVLSKTGRLSVQLGLPGTLSLGVPPQLPTLPSTPALGWAMIRPAVKHSFPGPRASWCQNGRTASPLGRRPQADPTRGRSGSFRLEAHHATRSSQAGQPPRANITQLRRGRLGPQTWASPGLGAPVGFVTQWSWSGVTLAKSLLFSGP